jgi:pyridoxamine 5'-phosphate oxidase
MEENPMNRDEILQFLNANPVCHLATMDGNVPRVRGMAIYKADATGIIFQTWNFKSVCKQVSENKRVELCFNGKGTQVRVAGVVEILNDLDLKKEISEARPFTKPLIAERGWDAVIVFKVVDCEASVWSMERNLEPTRFTKI